jgi:hypothetical protein
MGSEPADVDLGDVTLADGTPATLSESSISRLIEPISPPAQYRPASTPLAQV